ncbi:deoxyribose-phosphate aldolase [Fluviispira multicolorata]|uniref:Deoxyribose-phosphate aldolase n=1 Tax=Fluviispira multicolorata TaxID=2654512 RepID=A0A833JC66_9BACT|nr:deoxyribose-phosphate aldolase [Fluviispira multicolorata]KAB8029978.1 deoxyribose-phosphate aldolase [Fluviispira multicolorata]
MIKYSHIEVEKDYISRENYLTQKEGHLLSDMIDSTLLKQDLAQFQVESLCKEALDFNLRAICIPPNYVPFVYKFIHNSHEKIFSNTQNKTKICTVISFPLGYSTTESKINEVEHAVANHVDEIDFVQNVTFVKNNNFIDLEKEFLEIVKIAKSKVVKVILETALLNNEEIYKCSYLAAKCGIHIIKTSTGFSKRGATIEDISIIKSAIENHQKETGILLGIKASGGIRTLKNAKNLVKAGATRLGTSGAVEILQDKLNSNNY